MAVRDRQEAGPGVGLCEQCQHSRPVLSAKGSLFWLCGRAVTEPDRFAKYPRLPVVACAGFELASG